MNVFMLAHSKFDWSEFSRFLTDEGIHTGADYAVEPMSDAEHLVENAGRLCYMSYGKGRKNTREHIEHLIEVGHFSVLEHANFTLLITGVSRSLTHELVRHRHFSFSQLSQRYVDESESELVMPPALANRPDLQDVVRRAHESAVAAYRILVDNLTVGTGTQARKDARSAARCVLPNATKTKIVVTGNARTWREFIQKRDIPQADAEIRALARAVRDRLWHAAPTLFRDLMPEGQCASI